MNTISINSENKQTSDPYRSVLNLENKLNLKRDNKYLALSNISIYYT